ncbi:hypothetical protein PND19_01070 [Ligilactobacillus ruminis]|uniref:hypothetical protein n=1 Tax=Ligilactobacillus ruminis TaxID=1623 RepID=UPI00232E2B2B|nr:hypothetical protein [Ligilactobacillus ruminis]MDB7641228.1 hypothetical protein [Ligilactobacillus ruminis]MDB7646142.1 hypothetical protein [Ligilactobacillus ruminis]
MAKKEVDLRERLASDVLKIVETHEALIGVIDKENVEIKRLKRKRDRLLHDVDRLLYDVVKVEDKYGIGRGYLEGGTHFAEGSLDNLSKADLMGWLKALVQDYNVLYEERNKYRKIVEGKKKRRKPKNNDEISLF